MKYAFLFVLILFMMGCSDLGTEPVISPYIEVMDLYGVDAISAIVEYKTNGDKAYVIVNDSLRYDGPVPEGSIEFSPCSTYSANSIILYAERNGQQVEHRIR